MSDAVMWMPLDNENSATMTEDHEDGNSQNSDEHTQEIVLPCEEVRESLNYSEEMEDTEEDVMEYCDYYAPMECSCKSFWNSRYGRVVVYMFLVLLLLASLTSFIVVMQLIVVPYNRASIFQATNCSVVGVSEVVVDSHCTCSGGDQGCGHGQYTCLVIHVQYEDSDHDTQHNASIAENEITLGKNCSFYPACKSTHAENLQQLEEYKDIYGRYKDVYPCLYNPINNKQVIRTQHFRLHHVIHGIVWSLAFLMVTVVVLVYVLLKMKYVYYYK